MTTFKLSIIIPTYNCSRYITEALDSVLTQTCQSLEIIVVDDGSTDNTKEVVERWGQSDKVRYFYQENKGPAAARNKGIKEAKGEYVAFLDADDIWHSEKLKIQMEYFDKHTDISLAASEFEIIDNNSKLLGYSNRRRKIPHDGFVLKYVIGHYLLLSTIIVKRDVFEKVGFFNESLLYAEDTDMLIKIAKHFKIGLIDRFLVKHREHNTALTNTINLQRGQDRLKVLTNFLDKNRSFAKDNPIAVKKAMINAYYDYAEDLLYLSIGRIRNIRKMVWSKCSQFLHI